MATYIKIDTSNFKPFTFEDIIKPLVMQKENEDKFELALDEKQKEAALLLLLSRNDVDEEEYNTYLNYLSYLNSIADLFSKSGLAGGLGNKFRLAKNIYNTKISPIAARYTLREELKKAELALYDKDPSILFAKPAATRNLKDYSNGMPLSLHVSGKALEEEATKFALSYSQGEYDEPIIEKTAIDLYFLGREAAGIDKATMAAYEDIPIVKHYVDNMLSNISSHNYSKEDLAKLRAYIVNGLMLGAARVVKTQFLTNHAYSSRSLAGRTSDGAYVVGPNGLVYPANGDAQQGSSLGRTSDTASRLRHQGSGSSTNNTGSTATQPPRLTNPRERFRQQRNTRSYGGFINKFYGGGDTEEEPQIYRDPHTELPDTLSNGYMQDYLDFLKGEADSIYLLYKYSDLDSLNAILLMDLLPTYTPDNLDDAESLAKYNSDWEKSLNSKLIATKSNAEGRINKLYTFQDYKNLRDNAIYGTLENRKLQSQLYDLISLEMDLLEGDIHQSRKELFSNIITEGLRKAARIQGKGYYDEDWYADKTNKILENMMPLVEEVVNSGEYEGGVRNIIKGYFENNDSEGTYRRMQSTSYNPYDLVEYLNHVDGQNSNTDINNIILALEESKMYKLLGYDTLEDMLVSLRTNVKKRNNINIMNPINATNVNNLILWNDKEHRYEVKSPVLGAELYNGDGTVKTPYLVLMNDVLDRITSAVVAAGDWKAELPSFPFPNSYIGALPGTYGRRDNSTPGYYLTSKSTLHQYMDFYNTLLNAGFTPDNLNKDFLANVFTNLKYGRTIPGMENLRLGVSTIPIFQYSKGLGEAINNDNVSLNVLTTVASAIKRGVAHAVSSNKQELLYDKNMNLKIDKKANTYLRDYHTSPLNPSVKVKNELGRIERVIDPKGLIDVKYIPEVNKFLVRIGTNAGDFDNIEVAISPEDFIPAVSDDITNTNNDILQGDFKNKAQFINNAAVIDNAIDKGLVKIQAPVNIVEKK